MHRAGDRTDDLWNAEDVSAVLLVRGLRIATDVFRKILLSYSEKRHLQIKEKKMELYSGVCHLSLRSKCVGLTGGIVASASLSLLSHLGCATRSAPWCVSSSACDIFVCQGVFL